MNSRRVKVLGKDLALPVGFLAVDNSNIMYLQISKPNTEPWFTHTTRDLQSLVRYLSHL